MRGRTSLIRSWRGFGKRLIQKGRDRVAGVLFGGAEARSHALDSKGQRLGGRRWIWKGRGVLACKRCGAGLCRPRHGEPDGKLLIRRHGSAGPRLRSCMHAGTFCKHLLLSAPLMQACGSGGTTAGIGLGCHLAGLDLRVHAMAVCDDEAYFHKYVRLDCSLSLILVGWALAMALAHGTGFAGSDCCAQPVAHAADVQISARPQSLALTCNTTIKCLAGRPAAGGPWGWQGHRGR